MYLTGTYKPLTLHNFFVIGFLTFCLLKFLDCDYIPYLDRDCVGKINYSTNRRNSSRPIQS